ncbi:DUF6233 domain-containing protein [Streptomyces sp. NPDC050844]|uniref:DUF6233 domain-containing protein n=1 Tax=Streptomyces sp. NPDC050844 TaxID=3155790 RepID=UPI0033FFDB35
MNDPLPLTRLDLLRFLERVQERDLARTRKWIADEERREAERIRGEQARPPAPNWFIELGIGQGSPVYVHEGHCGMAPQSPRLKGITREQAREALHHRQVPGCPHCRPDSLLGVLE